jgi:hypothetical protein
LGYNVDHSPTHFSLYPIDRVAWGKQPGGPDDEDFHPSLFPFRITDEVFIEDVSEQFRDGEFDVHKPALGVHAVRQLEQIRYAIIHRFRGEEIDPATGRLCHPIGYSKALVEQTAACLRLIRPTTQFAHSCEGRIAEDGKLYIVPFYSPIGLVLMPRNQRLFTVRPSDACALRSYLPLFRKAMAGDYWKFRMAAQMHEAGYFQNHEWKAKYFLWTAALESLFTSQGKSMGAPVAKERIKFLLEPNTLIYPPGELVSSVLPQNMTVADVVDEVYCLRNNIAHGDKLPSYYFEMAGRDDFERPFALSRWDTLIEAISFLVRYSLLAILRKDLIEHFRDGDTSEAYFSANGLTQGEVRKHLRTLKCPS